ncbi:MAG: patatin-like phospholipase family protein [Burkholderiaceae bacterium]|jgi:NTE family protein|nr:patatin-like phospholipase family protein [Burkholderiaceae bacterium]
MPTRRATLSALGLLAAGHGSALPPGRADGSRRVGIVFGSGGMHGPAHVGAIRAFEQLGMRPAVIAGCSAGAIAGGLWAAGRSAAEIERLALDASWREVDRLRFPRLGFGDLQGLRSMIERHTGAARIEDLPTPFAAVATDLVTGHATVLRRGSLAAAVAASASVPIRYEPVQVDGRYLVDGALTAPMPVDAARALGADVVIAVDVAYRPYEAPVSGLAGVAFQMFHIMVNQLIAEQIRRADLAIRLDVHALMKDGANPNVMIEAGEHAVRAAWPALEARLRN